MRALKEGNRRGYGVYEVKRVEGKRGNVEEDAQDQMGAAITTFLLAGAQLVFNSASTMVVVCIILLVLYFFKFPLFPFFVYTIGPLFSLFFDISLHCFICAGRAFPLAPLRTNTDHLDCGKRQITSSVGEEAGATEVLVPVLPLASVQCNMHSARESWLPLKGQMRARRREKGGKHDPAEKGGVEGRRDHPMHHEPGQSRDAHLHHHPPTLPGAAVSDKPDRPTKSCHSRAVL